MEGGLPTLARSRWREGYPKVLPLSWPGQDGGYPKVPTPGPGQDTGRGTPRYLPLHPRARSGWRDTPRYLSPPPQPGHEGGGVPQGTYLSPLARSGWGERYPKAGGMPLAFTQEDFLVPLLFRCALDWWLLHLATIFDSLASQSLYLDRL